MREHSGVPPAVFEWFAGLDNEQRVPAAPLHQLLDLAAKLTGDENIGVRAGREMRLGDAGAIDYAMSSAETLEDVMRTTCRYSRLLGDPVDFSFSVDGDRVQVRHHNALLCAEILVCGTSPQERQRSRTWLCSPALPMCLRSTVRSAAGQA
jgi:hypothetical protein